MYVGPEPVLPVPRSYWKTKINDWVLDQHKVYWEGISTCRQAKSMLEKPVASFTKTLLSLNRPSLRTVTGIFTGHCPLNKHLALMGILPDPVCVRCNREEEDVFHLLCFCEEYTDLRVRFFGTLDVNPSQINKFSVKDLLGFAKATGRFLTEN